MDSLPNDPTPAELVADVPRALNALRRAVRDALRIHKLLGNPVAVWRNERVEWVQPEDIPILTDAELEALPTGLEKRQK